jgi:secondary thiamine-phosphate synthase enzyme
VSLSQATHTIGVETHGPGFVDITAALIHWLETLGADGGLLTVFVCHTSASLAIQENADPDVRADLRAALVRLAPEDFPYRHAVEGSDDMPAHIKAMLTGTSIGIPVQDGRPMLGTWQGVYLVEHRSAPQRRTVSLSFVGRIAEA